MESIDLKDKDAIKVIFSEHSNKQNQWLTVRLSQRWSKIIESKIVAATNSLQ